MNFKSQKLFMALLIVALGFDPNNSFTQSNITGAIRAIHIGGNWGTNRLEIPNQPEDYYQFLQRIKANWAGISVALHIENSLDDSVEKNYSDNVQVPTFRDNPLRDAIKGFKEHNIHVYLTLAIESHEAASSQYPVNRTQLGDPFAFNSDSNIKEEYWPWNPSHPNHTNFISSFWDSYAREAKYFAKIAEQEGVELFSIGTETDRLFRTRSGGPFPNNFLNQLKSVVDSVRSVYSGMVSYDMHYGVLEDTPIFSAGSDFLFQDLSLDVVGISSYFKLLESAPQRVVSINDFKEIWHNIFSTKLTPLKNRNPGLPILFLEFGYVDSPGSPFLASMDEFSNRVFIDNDNNGLDDGEEQQANIFQSFYTINEEFDRLVQGTFLWGNEISSETNWNNSFGMMRTFSIRNKLAEDVISQWYQLYKPEIETPKLYLPENGASGISINPNLIWYKSPNAISYGLNISDDFNFSNIIYSSLALTDTSININNLSNNTTYYWKTSAITVEGESDWSEVYSFTTEAATSIEDIKNVTNDIKLFQNYPNPFNSQTIIEFTVPAKSVFVAENKTGENIVSLKVYDILGNEIITLINKFLPPGNYKCSFNGKNFISGIYIYLLKIGKYNNSKKMILLK